MYLSIAFLGSCRPLLCETTYGKDVGDMFFFFFLKRSFDIFCWEDDSVAMSSISMIKHYYYYVYLLIVEVHYHTFCLYSNVDI